MNVFSAMSTHSRDEYFLQLAEYNYDQVVDENVNYINEDRFVFGLYYTDENVQPVVLSRDQNKLVGEIIRDGQNVARIIRSGIATACYSCGSEIRAGDGNIESVEIQGMSWYPDILQAYIDTDYLNEGKVFSITWSNQVDLCNSCEGSLESIRDAVFNTHSTLVISHQI